ncbi:hypothetical protein CDAR_56641 [Caerostris darwini]|uniref:Uncharacterized protein n=1 Tax=Caerostris darwini TaxID=1538125 RepID=A0AAV4VD82_9ARAC|nr:hypothetical protein CDAR_56641 [Caerostris darwini]
MLLVVTHLISSASSYVEEHFQEEEIPDTCHLGTKGLEEGSQKRKESPLRFVDRVVNPSVLRRWVLIFMELGSRMSSSDVEHFQEEEIPDTCHLGTKGRRRDHKKKKESPFRFVDRVVNPSVLGRRVLIFTELGSRMCKKDSFPS